MSPGLARPQDVKTSKIQKKRDFPGGPVVKTLRPHCRGHRFNPWLGNEEPACRMAKKEKKNLIV